SPLIESVGAAYSPVAVPRYEESPAQWIARSILIPAIKWHLADLPSLAMADQVAAEEFANSVIEVASDKKLWCCAVLPLSGVDVSGAEDGVATVGNITVRQLTEPQQSRWLEDSRSLLPPHLSPPDALLEIRSSRPRHISRSSDFRHTAESVLTAFQLHG